MKLVYTASALASLQECLNFLAKDIPPRKVNEIRDRILNKADQLLENPMSGQIEPYLESLGHLHRRLVTGNYKIIYRVDGDIIYITDVFDTRQHPSKMSGRSQWGFRQMRDELEFVLA